MSDGWSCAKCQSPNLPEDRFCGECGAPHHEPEPAPNPSAHSTITGILAEIKEQPSGALEGAPTVIITAIIAAAVCGGVYHFVAHSLFNLLLIFPVLLGVALGFCIKAAAVNSRCRRPAVLITVALVAGLAAYGFRQTLDTLRIQGDLKRLVSEKEGAVTINGQAADLVQLGFSDTLRLRAETGIGFGRARSSTRNTLRGAGFWIFLLVEAAIAAGMAAAAAYTFSRLPYCVRCRQLIPSVPVFRVNARDASRLTHFIRHQKWKEAQEMTDRASATETDRAEAILLKCGGCNGSSIRIDVHEGRRSKKIMHATLPPESLEALAKSA